MRHKNIYILIVLLVICLLACTMAVIGARKTATVVEETYYMKSGCVVAHVYEKLITVEDG